MPSSSELKVHAASVDSDLFSSGAEGGVPPGAPPELRMIELNAERAAGIRVAGERLDQ